MKEIDEIRKELEELEVTVQKDECHEEYQLIEFSLSEVYYSSLRMMIYPDKIVLEGPVIYKEDSNASKGLFDKYSSNFDEIEREGKYRYGKTLPRDTHQLKGYLKKIAKNSSIVGLNYELRYYDKYKAGEAADLLEKYGYPVEF